MVNLLQKILKYGLPVFMPVHRERIKYLMEMDGITYEEQEELYDLALHMNDANEWRSKALIEYYLSRGATFRNKLKNDEKRKRS